MPPPLPLAERFYRKVLQHPLEDGGCWEWTGAYSPGNRYWAPVVREGGQGSRVLRAVRWVLQQKTGESGEGLEAGHACDNQRCVNPEHLRWVTREENVQETQERFWKGRKVWERSVEGVVRRAGGGALPGGE